MEKLIDYLCEYEWVKNWYATMTTHSMKRELKCDYMLDESKDVIETWIVSKAFWFIKRLVENEKVDIEGNLNANGFEKLVDQTLNGYFPLLMLLAIQDNPIEFLIMILK